MFNFDETFDRGIFAEKSKERELARGGRNYKKDGSGRPRLFEKVRQKGRPCNSWLQKHNLNEDSHPLDWLVAFLKKPNGRGTIFNDWISWTNANGILTNCGAVGGLYPTWKPFSIKEIQQFVGVYILDGLSISPQIQYKFKSQRQDPVNGNDLCYQVFGSDAEKRYKQFRSLFVIQDPMLPIPNRKLAPNHKVDPLLLRMLKVFSECWESGPNVAGDEQDAGFKGNHPDKQRVSYKKEGDGFLIDALCDDGFTITFYFRNTPAPQKWVSKGFSPTHSR